MLTCSVIDCINPAVYEVITYQFQLETGGVVFERDLICPFLCHHHARKNEETAPTERTLTDMHFAPTYLYTNRARHQGVSIYMPVDFCDFGKPLPSKIQHTVIEKLGAFCDKRSEDQIDIGYQYTFTIHGSVVTIYVSIPQTYPFSESTKRYTAALARLRYEKQGTKQFRQTESLDAEWHWKQTDERKRVWMLYWHRSTDEWLRVLDEPTQPTITYWLKYIDANEDGVFDL